MITSNRTLDRITECVKFPFISSLVSLSALDNICIKNHIYVGRVLVNRNVRTWICVWARNTKFQVKILKVKGKSRCMNVYSLDIAARILPNFAKFTH